MLILQHMTSGFGQTELSPDVACTAVRYAVGVHLHFTCHEHVEWSETNDECARIS